jgi:hypothetical protein
MEELQLETVEPELDQLVGHLREVLGLQPGALPALESPIKVEFESIITEVSLLHQVQMVME